VENVPEFLSTFQTTITSNYLELLAQGKDTKYMYPVLGKVMEKCGLNPPTSEILIDLIRPADSHRFSPANFLPYPSLQSILKLLKERGYQIILISNIPESSGPNEPKFADLILKEYKIFHYFDHILLSGELQISKPNPLIFQKALELTGNLPSEIVHIGDSYAMDVVGASNMGLRTVWLSKDPLPENQDLSIFPDLQVESIDILYKILSIRDRT
jgi:HAD superfamily hydrolase (TIGR01509 family)